MTRRARSLSVVAILVAGAVGIISSTQTWLVAVLDEPSSPELSVAGNVAVPVLAPLSLATLALGLALSIVGRVVRYVFAGIALVIAVVLLGATAPLVVAPPVAAVATAVTETTGLSGAAAVADLVAGIRATPWPPITLVAGLLLAAGGVLALTTAHRWRGSGRRFRTDAGRAADGRPLDAIDSWDDLSRGDDPTAPPS